MFYETAQTIGPGWHGKTFKPSHYDDMSWTNPTSAARHFRSPGSSPTIRRRIINYDDDDDEPEPHTFQARSPTFERKFFKDVWNDRPRREDLFEDRPSLFKKTVKRDWDRDVRDFEDSLRRDRDFRNEYEEPEDCDYDGSETGSGRVHHIPIMVERQRGKMNDAKTYRSRCSSPPPPPSGLEQEHFVDESDEWLRNHMNRLKQNLDSGFSTMQNRHNRHRFPRVDLNSRPRAFTSPIPDWGPENVHTLPTRKLHSRVLLDERRNPKSVFRSYSETHEDIPREHPTASRSHSDSHCPKTAYVTKVNVNMPSENAEDVGTSSQEEIKKKAAEDVGTTSQEEIKKKAAEDVGTTSQEESAGRPEPPRRRMRHRPRKEEENTASEQETEQFQGTKNLGETSAPDNQTESKTTEVDEGKEADVHGDSRSKKNSLKDGRGATAHLQISAVLQNVEDLLRHVEAYNGNGRDKQFRFLDEMLTRCMIRLDDVDTDGLDDVRLARKAAVRQVQACIEKLESRANEDRGKKNGEPQNETKPVESAPEEESERSEEESKPSPTNEASNNEAVEQTRL